MKASERLCELFYRNGVLRVPDEKRRKKEGSRYRHGYEARLVAFNETELKQIQKSLQVIGLQAGNPFEKSNRIVVPIYGREQVRKFLSIVDFPSDDLPEALHSSTNA